MTFCFYNACPTIVRSIPSQPKKSQQYFEQLNGDVVTAIELISMPDQISLNACDENYQI